LNTSETTRDRAVTIEHQQEVIGCLPNGDIFNDLHGSLIPFSRSRHFWSWNIISKGQSFYRTV